MRIWAKIINRAEYGRNPQQRLSLMSKLNSLLKGRALPLRYKEEARVINQGQPLHQVGYPGHLSCTG